MKKPNKETIEAMKEVEEGNCKSCDTIEELIEELKK